MKQSSNLTKPLRLGHNAPPLTKKKLEELITQLRPLVHVGGQCSCCVHEPEEIAAIGQAVLDWWAKHDFDPNWSPK